jgi:hypothetical protein
MDFDQVTELSLDNVRSVGEFEGLTDEFVNLEKLRRVGIRNTGNVKVDVSVQPFPSWSADLSSDLKGIV